MKAFRLLVSATREMRLTALIPVIATGPSAEPIRRPVVLRSMDLESYTPVAKTRHAMDSMDLQ
jgi:hypothetical protein